MKAFTVHDVFKIARFTDAPCISLSKDQISKKTNIKFLGLLIDEELSWKSHITHLSKRRSSACYALRAIAPDLSTDILKMIYYAYVHSLMSYGIIFW